MGGIPRYVLQYAGVEAQQVLLQEAIESSDLKKVLNSVGHLAGPKDVSHKVIHIIVTPNFQRSHIDFASPYVSKEVAKHYEKTQREDLRNFLASSDGLGPLGALRGNLFEGYAHNKLQIGGPF